MTRTMQQNVAVSPEPPKDETESVAGENLAAKMAPLPTVASVAVAALGDDRGAVEHRRVNLSTSARFWDRIAERYSRQPVADEASYQRKLEITREHFRPDSEVLEFGCGTGSTAIAHAPHVKHIHAIDISSKMIEIAQRKAEDARIENVTFEQGTIEEVEVPDGALDVVLGLSILHLLEDRDAAIAKVHRMLKPGGVFVSSTACLGDSHMYLRPILPLARIVGLAPMVRFFTAKELERSLAAAGFRIDLQWQPGKGKAVFIVASKA